MNINEINVSIINSNSVLTSTPFASIICSPLGAESTTSPASPVIWKCKQIADQK